MKSLRIALPLILLSACCALAYDLTLRDGTVLKDIRLKEKTDLGIKVTHESGVTFIDYAKLPTPDLWTFGFDEKLYKAATTSAADAKRLAAIKPEQSRAANSSTTTRPTRLYTSGTTARPAAPSTSGASQQCGGTTQKGFRCRRMVRGGGNCYQH